MSDIIIKRQEVTTEIALEVTLKGTLETGSESRFCPEFGNYLPGDPGGVSDLRVYLGDLDITDRLSAREIQSLESDFESALRTEDEV